MALTRPLGSLSPDERIAYDFAIKHWIEIDEKHVPCRFGCKDQPAVGYFLMDEGCLCYSQDKSQVLCVGHMDRSSPFGSYVMSTVHDLSYLGLYLRRHRGRLPADVPKPDGVNEDRILADHI